ncbi:MAG: hypothetical protein ACI4KA_01725 [Oscillospiraceae bacterium]
MKKILHNVWLVQDKLPSSDRDSKSLYFAGLCTSEIGNEVSRFEPLSADTRVYKSKRSADSAARVANQHYESPFIESVFIESAEIDVPETTQKAQKVPQHSPTESAAPTTLPSLVLVPESELCGWITLDKLCGKYPLMLRKKVGIVFRFAIAYSEKEIRYLPADEVFAWTRYFEECTKFVVGKIRDRRIAEGKDPDGADEWKKGAGA